MGRSGRWVELLENAGSVNDRLAHLLTRAVPDRTDALGVDSKLFSHFAVTFAPSDEPVPERRGGEERVWFFRPGCRFGAGVGGVRSRRWSGCGAWSGGSDGEVSGDFGVVGLPREAGRPRASGWAPRKACLNRLGPLDAGGRGPVWRGVAAADGPTLGGVGGRTVGVGLFGAVSPRSMGPPDRRPWRTPRGADTAATHALVTARPTTSAARSRRRCAPGARAVRWPAQPPRRR